MVMFTVLPPLLSSAIFDALNKNDALLISSVARRDKLIGFLKISESAFAF